MELKATKQVLNLADEMWERKARCGRDYPASLKQQTRKNMESAGLVESKVNCPYEGRSYYFTEKGLAWYLELRPECGRAG